MTSEQGSGGGAVGGSPPMANSQNEPMQDEAENNMNQQQDESQAQYTQNSRLSPRQLEELRASSSSTPESARLAHPYPSAYSSNASTPAGDISEACTSYYQYKAGSLEPPVTKKSLSELDVSKIIHNPKLRHDINFDADLHFRPNLEGEKGRRKQDRSNQFWNALEEQLTEFVVDRDTFYLKYGDGSDWCLPTLLEAVKGIMQTLVPQRDRAYLDEGFNVNLLMQQFNRGVADLEKLASWLSSVLKCHCAPMRDDNVDEMYNQLSYGNRNNDMGELVRGMRSLLSVLEAMKLDVANHQIRCLRPLLIEDTAHFEQRYFYKKIAHLKMDVRPSKLWYREACRRYSSLLEVPAKTQAFGDATVFFEALSRLVLPSAEDSTLPNTLEFDAERIHRLRSDMMDIINLEICMKAYEDMEGYGGMLASLQGLGEQGRPGTPDSVFSGSASLASSRPSSLVMSAAGSASASPRSSFVMPSHASDAERELKAQELYDSLKAILHTAPHTAKPADRWRAVAPAMALQVFRYANAPRHALPIIEGNITSLVADVHSPRYRELEEYFFEKFVGELERRVKRFRGLSGLTLYSIATGERAGGRHAWEERGEGVEAREDEGIAGMASRLAHLGILHWRVWSRMLYLQDDSMEYALA